MTFSRLLKYKIIDVPVTAVFDFFFPAVRIFIRKNREGGIVVVNLHKLGDSVCTIPAVKKIMGFHKENIVMFCFPETTKIFKLAFDNIEMIELHHSDFYFDDRIASKKARRKLKDFNPRLIYDLTGSSTSASLIFNSSSEKIIGINKRLYSKIYTKFVPIREEPHIIDIYLDAVRNLDFRMSNYPAAKFKLQESGRILIHPFAGWKAKEWSLNKYISLAENLNKKYKTSFIIPKKSLNSDIIKEILGKGIGIIETETTDELIEKIKISFLLIGNDSGPVHIANLLGIPTFTIYGPSNPEYHKPYEGLNSYIIKKINCSPKKREKVCFTDGGRVGCPSFECMNLLTIEEVEESVLKFIMELTEKRIKQYSE